MALQPTNFLFFPAYYMNREVRFWICRYGSQVRIKEFWKESNCQKHQCGYWTLNTECSDSLTVLGCNLSLSSHSSGCM